MRSESLFVAAIAVGLNLTMVGGVAAQTKPSTDIDRSATLRFVWTGTPAQYDPMLSKNQFQDMPYMFPVYDSLVRLDAKGQIVPDLATSWSFSPDGLTLTMRLRKGVKFTDGSDLTAAVVAKNLTRIRKDPASLMQGQLRTMESFEAKDPETVVIHFDAPNPAALYALATSAGMIASGKALDEGVNIGLTPVGSGPYKLISSGPQGANYERNEDYFDKSQNQFAKLTISPVIDISARLAAVQTGQADAGLFQVDQQTLNRVNEMVQTGKFFVHKAYQPNSLPLWFNTKIKPFDNIKVRQAMTLAIDRNAISQGITNGECKPAGQPLQPGVVGHDESLVAPAMNVAKAKALLQEAGVGPFSFDALVSAQEPTMSVGLAMKAQFEAIGITMNIVPTPSVAIRPQFRGGTHGAMVTSASVPAPDPASIIDAYFMGGDNPGGVTPEFAKAVAEARTKPLDSPDRVARYKAISKMAYDDPRQIYVCWSPVLVVARKGIVGVENEAYLDAAPLPDLRTYGLQKGP